MSDDNEFNYSEFMIYASLIVMLFLGFATLIAIGYFASNPTIGRFVGVLLAGGVTAVDGLFTARYIQKSKKTMPTENELLDWKQRRDLRKARAKVIVEKALVDIEHERDNIIHERMLEASDPNRPPHQTPWTPPTDPRIDTRRY